MLKEPKRIIAEEPTAQEYSDLQKKCQMELHNDNNRNFIQIVFIW